MFVFERGKVCVIRVRLLKKRSERVCVCVCVFERVKERGNVSDKEFGCLKKSERVYV